MSQEKMYEVSKEFIKCPCGAIMDSKQTLVSELNSLLKKNRELQTIIDTLPQK